MPNTRLIGLDWGTSSLRAFRIGAGGEALDRRDGPYGILRVPDGDFEGTLRRLAGDWLEAHAEVPILASGMITSRQGWVEVPYLDCPAGARELAAGILTRQLRDGRPIHFVPGLLTRVPGDAPDVMRGEETQIVGAVDDADSRRLFVLPGTHSKWARVENGRVLRFSTFLTGELYAVLRAHTILGRTMQGEAFDAAAFTDGVRCGHAPEGPAGGLLHRLFGVRTRGLVGGLAPDVAACFLSGLLIGCEIREATAIFGREEAVDLVGGQQLVRHYAAALAVVGRSSHICPEEVVARGHWRIAAAAGLVA